jgi:hypothetical protein
MSSVRFPRLVGVLHLPPLPGSPRHTQPMAALEARVAEEARLLVDAGFEGLVVENFGDAPFFAGAVPPVTVAALTALALAARAVSPGVPLGVNVLRNDGAAALSVAAAVGASFVRINVLTGARVTDQGVVQGDAAALLRLRRSLGLDGVALFADVDVKHSAPLAPRSLAAEVKDTVLRGLADAVLVTGEGTGVAVDEARLTEVRQAAAGAPVYVASGATVDALPRLASRCDGVLVGSALRAGGRAGEPLDAAAVEAFAAAFRRAFGPRPGT